MTRLTTFLATLISCPGAPAKFAREGLLGDALLALAGLSAVEVGRTHLTGQPFQPQSDHLLCVPSPQLNLSPALYPSPLLLLIPHPPLFPCSSLLAIVDYYCDPTPYWGPLQAMQSHAYTHILRAEPVDFSVNQVMIRAHLCCCLQMPTEVMLCR